MIERRGGEELAGAVGKLRRGPGLRRATGGRARELASAERGATTRAVAEIQRLSEQAIPAVPEPLILRVLLWPFTHLWRLGGQWKRRTALARRRALKTPVISVGGIGMGGAGKTPFTLWLADRLKAGGLTPAILTRGYRRRVPENSTILAAGAPAPASLTGDEAQLFLRARTAHVGIGADRYRTGALLGQRYPVRSEERRVGKECRSRWSPYH